MPTRVYDRGEIIEVPTREEIEARKEREHEQRERVQSQRAKTHEKLRRDLAAAKIAEQRLVEIQEAIATVEGAIDALADRHSTLCAPLQEQLVALDEQRIDSLLAHDDECDSAAEHELKIRAKIREHNEHLEIAIATKNATLKKLHEERHATALRCDRSIIEADLFRYGREDLRAAHFAATQAHGFAKLRYDTASTRPTSAPSAPSAYWRAELQAAEAALAAAGVALREAYQRVIDDE